MVLLVVMLLLLLVTVLQAFIDAIVQKMFCVFHCAMLKNRQTSLLVYLGNKHWPLKFTLVLMY